MGRKAKPIDLHLIEGNKSHKTKAEINARKEAEAALTFGTDKVRPPSWLSKEAKALFKEYAKQMAALPAKLMTNADVMELAILCDSYTRYQDEVDERVRSRLWERIAKISSNFGFNPSARAKLAMPKKEKKTPTEFDRRFPNV